jgi:ferric-dicitrate binding protein FerR (iron transport regulator)
VQAAEDAAVEGPSEASRAQAIEAIARALEGRRAAMRAARLRRTIGMAAAAAVLLVGAGFAAKRGLHPVAVAAGTENQVSLQEQGAGGESQRADGSKGAFGSDVSLGQGSRVLASAGGTVHLAFATGTELDLSEKGTLEVAETGSTQAFKLERGSVSAHVAKLPQGKRFLVRTSDAEVEVRGTRFSVTVAQPASCENGTSTRVAVQEGVVVVRGTSGEVTLRAGDSWPRCETTDATKPKEGPSHVEGKASELPAKPSAFVANAGPTLPTAQPASPTSSLAEQNALFKSALADKAAGNDGAAVATFDKLLQRYPQSPLAESASTERLRLLAKQGSPRAKSAAREYLVHYPNGFAKGLAESLSTSPSSP